MVGAFLVLDVFGLALLSRFYVRLGLGPGVVSLQLMRGLAMSRTIKHTNPPAAVPHMTGADT